MTKIRMVQPIKNLMQNKLQKKNIQACVFFLPGPSLTKVKRLLKTNQILDLDQAKHVYYTSVSWLMHIESLDSNEVPQSSSMQSQMILGKNIWSFFFLLLWVDEWVTYMAKGKFSPTELQQGCRAGISVHAIN